MLVSRTAPFGPPVLLGPTLGLASTGGAQETVVAGRRARKRQADSPEPLPEESVPPGADDQPGMKLRVRGLRTG
jgi:hypothetical protein